MRWGPTRLAKFLQDELGTATEPGTGYLFVNNAQDHMLVYWLTGDGGESIQKKLDRGAFLMPTAAAGESLVMMRPTALAKLFR